MKACGDECCDMTAMTLSNIVKSDQIQRLLSVVKRRNIKWIDKPKNACRNVYRDVFVV